MMEELHSFGARGRFSLGPVLLLLFASFLTPPPATAVINGTVESSNAYGAVAWFRGGCSAVLVAPRVMLTSAHCMPDYALGCQTLAAAPLSVTFAQPGGGWANNTSFNNRTVAVQGFVQRPEIFDLSQCLPDDAYSCLDFVDPDGAGPLNPPFDRATVDHSRELVVLYLANDEPADVTPLPILVSPNVDTTYSAAETATYGDLESWVPAEERVITTVGYGVGSHGYSLFGQTIRGRDFGQQRWVETQSDFAGYLGAASCNALVPSGSRPGVVVSPRDLTPAQVEDPTTVAPGADFSPSLHVHSGGGDSGGPVLVGAGISARDDIPDPLPSPSTTYDPSRNYIVGTASIWVAYGGEFATAFTPTWTVDASTFLMQALYDMDGDGFADPVDPDTDGDGCEDDIDQHPFDRWVPVGVTYYPNCSPSSEAYLGDESLDIEPDGLKNCEDTDDDNDGLPDWPVSVDPCPVDANQFCFAMGPPCPWNPIFFDCVLAGCNDLFLRLTSLVNPDPTQEILIPILSSSLDRVVVGPIQGSTLQETTQLLSGGLGGFSQRAGETEQFYSLDITTGNGEVIVLAVYHPARVVVTSLVDANALELRFGQGGQTLEIFQTIVPAVPAQNGPGHVVLVVALITLAALGGLSDTRFARDRE